MKTSAILKVLKLQIMLISSMVIYFSLNAMLALEQTTINYMVILAQALDKSANDKDKALLLKRALVYAISHPENVKNIMKYIWALQDESEKTQLLAFAAKLEREMPFFPAINTALKPLPSTSPPKEVNFEAISISSNAHITAQSTEIKRNQAIIRRNSQPITPRSSKDTPGS